MLDGQAPDQAPAHHPRLLMTDDDEYDEWTERADAAYFEWREWEEEEKEAENWRRLAGRCWF